MRRAGAAAEGRDFFLGGGFVVGANCGAAIGMGSESGMGMGLVLVLAELGGEQQQRVVAEVGGRCAGAAEQADNDRSLGVPESGMGLVLA